MGAAFKAPRLGAGDLRHLEKISWGLSEAVNTRARSIASSCCTRSTAPLERLGLEPAVAPQLNEPQMARLEAIFLLELPLAVQI